MAKLKSKGKEATIPKFVDQTNVNIPIDQLISNTEKHKVLSHYKSLVQKHFAKEHHKIDSRFNKSFIQAKSNDLLNKVQNLMDITHATP
jgi:hypothetical protein